MSLFRKKAEAPNCCSVDCSAETMEAARAGRANGARIKILGTGCAKCAQLEKNTLEALKQLGWEAEVDHVTDFTQIAAYGVMTTPALVAGGRVVSYGKVLKTQEIIELLQKVGKA